MHTKFRPEEPRDFPAIAALLEAAFPGPGEARLVERLRADGDVAFALVAVEGERIVGHLMFSVMEAPFRAVGLAPVAVAPDRQRTGIGSRLIREGLRRAGDEGWQGVFVVGDPDYYGRFGFDQDRAADFESPYAGPYLMALPPNGGALPTPMGRIDYAAAFAALA